MDLNELLWQHQRAIMIARLSPSGPCASRFDLVGHYAERIRRLRLRMGVPAYPDWVRASG